MQQKRCDGVGGSAQGLEEQPASVPDHHGGGGICSPSGVHNDHLRRRTQTGQPRRGPDRGVGRGTHDKEADDGAAPRPRLSEAGGSRVDLSSPEYKQASRRYVSAMVALPILLVTSYFLLIDVSSSLVLFRAMAAILPGHER